jgi:hypothetical protein
MVLYFVGILTDFTCHYLIEFYCHLRLQQYLKNAVINSPEEVESSKGRPEIHNSNQVQY